jgi:hypothetical protein
MVGSASEDPSMKLCRTLEERLVILERAVAFHTLQVNIYNFFVRGYLSELSLLLASSSFLTLLFLFIYFLEPRQEEKDR